MADPAEPEVRNIFEICIDSVGDAEGAQAKLSAIPTMRLIQRRALHWPRDPSAFPKGFSEPSTGICQAMYAAVAETCEDTTMR